MFDRVQPELFGTPGAQTNSWADFDGDGDLDLSITNNDEAGGTHHLYRNLLAPAAAAHCSVGSPSCRVINCRKTL